MAAKRSDSVTNGDSAITEIEVSQLARSAGDVGVTREGQALPRLQGTRVEAKSIMALAPAQSRLALDSRPIGLLQPVLT